MASLEEVTATKEIGGEKKSATVFVDLGADCDDAVSKFGAEVVHSNFKGSARITLQAAIRRYMEAGKTQEEITELLKDWKPGVAITRMVDPVGALLAKFGTMDEEAKQAILDKLMAKLAS